MPDWEARFFAKVRDSRGCWEWVAGKDTRGYGQFWLGGQMRRAHCVAYRLFIGPIPRGLELDHLCRNRTCVNPYHLEPVTHAENMRRGDRANKTHCSHGHKYSKDNTYHWRNGRKCRICHLANSRKHRERKAYAPAE